MPTADRIIEDSLGMLIVARRALMRGCAKSPGERVRYLAHHNVRASSHARDDASRT